MTSEVIQLKPCTNIALALRNIAEQIDNGELICEDMTIIAGTKVFHLGTFDDGRAAESAIFNMTLGIQKLMKPVLQDV